MPFTPPTVSPRFSGSGKVFKGDLFLSDVRYAIAFDRNDQNVSGPTTTGIIPTDSKFNLLISAESPAIQARADEKLTLHLEDGTYHLDFYWWNGRPNVTNGIY